MTCRDEIFGKHNRLAAGVLHAAQRQETQGGTWHVTAHLARIADSPITNSTPDAQPAGPQLDLDDCMAEQQTDKGLLTYPLPALTTNTRWLNYPSVAGTWGARPGAATATSNAESQRRPGDTRRG
jgi:hypothetical protein